LAESTRNAVSAPAIRLFPNPSTRRRWSGFRSASKLRNHLRPDRNHRDKQRNRRQRRRFFHKHPQHRPTPYDMRTYEEHCSFFVLGVKGRWWRSLKNGPKEKAWLMWTRAEREHVARITPYG